MTAEEFKINVLPLREKLYRIAFRMVEEEQDAEDAVQEVYLKLWHLRDTLDRYDSVTAFATVVTKNICVDKLRVRFREEPIEDHLLHREATGNPHTFLERSDTDRLIRQIIDQLPPLQRMIIQMKDIDEMEVEEIAVITGANAEAVRMNLSRARKKVREQFLKLN
ncbi:MAG: RNA polymerase sigma factor [Bacteroidales bacterium]